MAAVISEAPAAYSPAHEDLWFKLTSNNSGTTNFKFVVDVIVTGQNTTTVKVFPDASGYGFYNAGPVVRSYIQNYFEPSGNSILVASSDKYKISYTIQAGEEVSGVITTNQASGSYTAANYYRPLFSDYYASGNQTFSTYYAAPLAEYEDDFLTERDVNINASNSDKVFVSFFRKNTGTYTAYCDVVNEAGSTLSSHSATITLNEFNLLNIGTDAINTWAGSTLIGSTAYGYKFYINRSGHSSRKIFVRLKCYPKFQPINLHFLNRLGGWDTMKFALANKRISSFEKQQFAKPQWQTIDGSKRIADSYNRISETNINFNIQHTNKMNLISDWISEQDSYWGQQLVASSQVYLEMNGGYFPVTIDDNNYEFKYDNINKTFNIQLTATVGRVINSQFR